MPNTDRARIQLTTGRKGPARGHNVIKTFYHRCSVRSTVRAFLPNICGVASSKSKECAFVNNSAINNTIICSSNSFLCSRRTASPYDKELIGTFSLIQLRGCKRLSRRTGSSAPIGGLPSFARVTSFTLGSTNITTVLGRRHCRRTIRSFNRPTRTPTDPRSFG